MWHEEVRRFHAVNHNGTQVRYKAGILDRGAGWIVARGSWIVARGGWWIVDRGTGRIVDRGSWIVARRIVDRDRGSWIVARGGSRIVDSGAGLIVDLAHGIGEIVHCGSRLWVDRRSWIVALKFGGPRLDAKTLVYITQS